jgi:hypothetical protein
MKELIGCLLVVAACGGGGKNDGTNDNSDGNNDSMMIDAPPAPLMITLSGTAVERAVAGTTPVNGATIAAYAEADENTALATTTTAADGTFTLTIMTTGTAVTGFLKATKTGLATSYLYPPTAISADLAMIPMNMVQPTLLDNIYTIAGEGPRDPAKGTLGLIVLSGAELSSTPVVGAKVTTTPASKAYRYSGSGGLPTSMTATNTDGLAYALDVPVGAISVAATKTGSTFKPTSLKIRTESLTQTIVTP